MVNGWFGPLEAPVCADRDHGCDRVLCGASGFDQHDLGVDHASGESSGEAGHDRVSADGAMAEQDVDEHPGAVAVAEPSTRQVPEALVDLTERARGPGRARAVEEGRAPGLRTMTSR